MATRVTVVFVPDCPPPEGYIPSIDMLNPRNASLRFVPDLISITGPEGELYGFEMDELEAKKLLFENCHVYKVWEPESLKVMVPDRHGAQKLVELKSINPVYIPAVKPEPVLVDKDGKPLPPEKVAKVLAAQVVG